MQNDRTPVLQLEQVRRTFIQRDGSRVDAVRPTDLVVGEGEVVALVGESGSGKSTLANIALALETPDSGRVLLDGCDLGGLAPRELRRTRTAMQPVFQDSTAAFNPRRTVAQILREALECRRGRVDDPRGMAADILERVGLHPGHSFLDRYHHELSGGQRQRLGIARAIAAKPRVMIADEPLSGADVSIRGQILNLLLGLQRSEKLAILFITHDISIAEVFADRVVVMYRGEVVEEGPAGTVLTTPAHPYTRLLKAAVPSMDDGDVAIGDLLVSRPEGSGCNFHARCALAMEHCPTRVPEFGPRRHGRRYKCFRAAETGPDGEDDLPAGGMPGFAAPHAFGVA
jgi:oligopeptide/dipeptide ABC transporter ATP-binding protein